MGQLKYDGPTNSKLTLSDQITEDKKYGIMKPANDKYFTYRVMDWEGRLINSSQIQRGVTYIWEELERKLNIDVRRAKLDEIADFKVYFRRTIDDQLLDSNTIMYHFFPINDIKSPNRGVCVVNADFPFTVNGKPADLHYIDPEHYPDLSGLMGKTYDFDQVYRHEIDHGMGLPHSKNTLKVLSSHYGIMAEYYEDEEPQETLPRLYAKYQKRSLPSRIALRWEKWKRYRFDDY